MKKIFFLLLLILPLGLAAQVITTFAGTGSSVFSGDGGQATDAGIPDPSGGVFDRIGNFYFSDGIGSNRIRKVDMSGIITTVVGNGAAAYSGDGGQATAASINTPWAVTLDSIGNIYIADGSNSRIRKVDVATGIITTIAGDGTGAFRGDGGLATAAEIWDPNDLCFDKFGNLYVADLYNHRVRKINTSGIITTFAGPGSASYLGDGGPATDAYIAVPQGLACDDSENIYIADASTGRVRKVNSAGIITTVAGTTVGTFSGDGVPATTVAINPIKVGIDLHNNLFIADKYNTRVFMVDSMGIIHNIAGTGVSGFAGDGGPASTAEFNYPAGICFDKCGNLYIPEPTNRRIRKITYPTTAPVVSLSAPTSSAIGSTVTLSATVTGGCCTYTDSILWMDNGVVFARTATTSVTFTKTMQTDSISAVAIGCGDTATSSIYVITRNTTGLPGLGTGGLSCYPNPATSQLYVSAPADIESVVVANLVGQVVVSSAESHGQSAVVDINALPAGVYFVKVNNLWLQRFVKR